ncbi:Hypothetical predicted protein, partial [Mytilus galloprovincialis]
MPEVTTSSCRHRYVLRPENREEMETCILEMYRNGPPGTRKHALPRPLPTLYDSEYTVRCREWDEDTRQIVEKITFTACNPHYMSTNTELLGSPPPQDIDLQGEWRETSTEEMYPLIFAFLPDKCQTTYQRLFAILKASGADNNTPINPNIIFMDFESAAVMQQRQPFLLPDQRLFIPLLPAHLEK